VPDPFGELDATGAQAFTWTLGVVTHFSLHAPRVDPIADRDDPLVKNFVADRFA
jgi:hypothetical protein